MSGLGNATVTRRGFTLTEMLVVMAVIAILAGMVLAVLPGVTEKRTRSVVRAELAVLVAAIEYYKEKNGFYPPDNLYGTVTHPPLFYELVGTTNNNDEFFPLNGAPPLKKDRVLVNFGSEGFMNTATTASDVHNFLKNLKERQYAPSPWANDGSLALLVPAKGPPIATKPGAEHTNTWRYVVAKPNRRTTDPYPTNNPNSFDLWSDVDIRGKVVTIGNWKQEK